MSLQKKPGWRQCYGKSFCDFRKFFSFDLFVKKPTFILEKTSTNLSKKRQRIDNFLGEIN
jgi:hypothetical protein